MTWKSLRLMSTVIEVFGLALWVELMLRRRPFERVLDRIARTVSFAAGAACPGSCESVSRRPMACLPLTRGWKTATDMSSPTLKKGSVPSRCRRRRFQTSEPATEGEEPQRRVSVSRRGRDVDVLELLR